MAMDTNFDVLIRAIYDKKSGDKAASDLEREVMSAIGSDRIEVPLALSKKFSKNIGKEIRTAQEDTMRSLDVVLRKGLSSSNEELDDFAKKYENFLKLLSKNKSPQSQGRLAQLKSLGATNTIKSYSNYMKALQKAKDKWTNDIIEKENRKQRLKGVRREGPKGFKRDLGFDTGIATKKTVQESDFSPYRSNWARQMKISELASIKWMQESLKTYKDNEVAEKFANNAISTGGNKKKLTEQEKNLEKSENVSNQLAKILGGLEHNRPDTTIEQFNQYLEGLLKFNEGSNKNVWDGVLLTLNKTFNRYASKGAIGATDGSTRGEAEGHANAMHALAGMIGTFKKALEQDVVIKINEKELQVSQEQLRALKALGKVDPRAAEKEINAILYGNKSKGKKQTDKNTIAENSQLQKELNNMTKEQKQQNDLTERQTQLDTIEHSRENVADSTLKDIEKTDAEDGSNSESNFKILLDKLDDITTLLSGVYDILQGKLGKSIKSIQSVEELKEVAKKLQKAVQPSTQLALPPGKEEILEERKRKNPFTRSEVTTSVMDFSKKLPQLFSKKIMAATSEEQDKMNADLKRRYGIGVGAGPDEAGDKVRIGRRMSFWRGNDRLEELFKNFKITPGIKIDTTEITSAMAEALSGAEMFKAQSGGWLNNLAIAMTGGLAARFQPSLEKTRAQADAVNTVMADMREKFNTIIQDILDKESALSDMYDRGDIDFNEEGEVISGTSEARVTAIELEKSKDVLASLLADAGMVREVVKETGGNLGEIVKMLGFTSPMLRKNNAIIANINAGLDKTGKALKFQRRSQEILNYTFQLMGRHIGQILKRWLLMLNPISLIRKAFSDFASYDIKWQRTMNVIKYNIRRIIKPFMEWLAQQLVNIIGLANALVKGIGKVFGYDWDLFDQAAAATEKQAEEIQNVSAGFDELHDIGGDNTGANDLMGDIYTPQWDDLYKGIESFGENVANVFKNIHDTVEGWNFWNWLAVGATALGGVLLFRWLIDTFSKGKNPLQSVADGFKSLERNVGWALLVWAFASLVDSLKDFIDVVGKMESAQVGQALISLAGALAIVGATIIALLIALSAVVSTGVGALAIAGLAAIIAAVGLVIYAYADLIRATADLTDAIGRNKDAIIEIIQALATEFIRITIVIGTIINTIFETVGNIVCRVIDTIITKISELVTTVVTSIGGTIKDIIRTVGDIIIEVIDAIIGAIPRLLDSILNFCREIGPAIEGSVDSVIRSITKLVNFVVSAVEYIANLVIGAINSLSIEVPSWVPVLGGKQFGFNLQPLNIPRFVPKYEKGTNYVPNDGLAYLHQGEAVIPKKYNQPYNQGLTNEERAYMQQMMSTMKSLDGTMKQGIAVKGQFVQRGSDLVAVVNKTKSQTGADLLSNASYAR